ncbi:MULTISPECIES: two-component sensor histidine kinase BarA [Dickeya]|uniref:histidine kinase n=1 Tax=Dickeya fangzhongdai TaxID=1778540 RepID=A0A2K8QSB8_9GAMM|nr:MULTISPECIES: two-component sensor histidine kinase BarA [Dickeya]ATZ95650.1 two-component sensor histidine kinase BarA [Dickeya fangzhongdai]MBO8136007.1 two-component sensor histidine kinase BarA [Dickeya fangzhongdai]QOH49095.1 two-component sensor histidine kinase BarA [Dickeya fangzhongdai]QOH53398.1 two-component sensor histidine kinase BarA [Dickeya fangzhongdai]UGA50243.1 two-component sensor histidine kinase BarA [Dickeya fangzhongdai]
MTKYSLRARMMILILAPTMLIGLLLSSFFVIHRYNQLQEQLADAGASIIQPLAVNSAYALTQRQPESLRQLVNMLHRHHSGIVRTISVFDARNQLIVTSNPNNPHGQLLQVPSGNPLPTALRLQNEEECLVLQMPIENEGEVSAGTLISRQAPMGYVAVELDLNTIRLQQYREMFMAAMLLLFCMGVAMLLAYRLMRDVTIPIRNMVETVDRIRRGQLDSRVEGHMLGELDMLKNGINSMAMSLTAYHEEMQQNIDQATYDLRETLEQMEIQNVELDLAKKRAQEAARIKSEFLANMSHELRTPLNGVIGFTRQTLKTQLTPTQKDYLQTIERSANNLLNIINDVLDFSKLEAGKLVLENIPFSLHNTLDEVIMLLAHTAHEKGLELTLNIQHDVPEQFVGDPLRLQQIITNLLGNAIKFTEQGNIDIRIEKRRQESLQVLLEIQIKDTGIGIAEAQQTQLFQAFRQADTSISRQHGGTGLGLVITQRLVREMGGDISFHSKLNQGTTFWCTVNLQMNPHVLEPDYHFDSLQGKHLAYVEANPAAAQATLDILVHTPLTVSYSPTMEQLPERTFDILLIGVPIHYRNTLLDFTPQIRDFCRLASCVILALPSMAEMEAEQLKSFGIHASLSKPITAPRLLPMLQDNSLFSQDSSERALPPPAASLSRLPLSVMAVDDNPANLKLIGALLEEQVENIILCESGADAIARAQGTHLDIILMDIQMPGMDGLQASEHIRRLSQHAHTPIVAVTAHTMSGEREVLLQSGMDDYLSKPIDEQMLRQTLLRHACKTPSELPAPPMPMMAVTAQSPLSLDWDLALRQAASKPDLARDLLAMLLDFLPDVRQQVDAVLAGNSPDNLVDIIHKLHGSCSYSGVPRLKQICHYLEQSLRKGLSADELEPEWLELMDEMTNVEKAARKRLEASA